MKIFSQHGSSTDVLEPRVVVTVRNRTDSEDRTLTLAAQKRDAAGATAGRHDVASHVATDAGQVKRRRIKVTALLVTLVLLGVALAITLPLVLTGRDASLHDSPTTSPPDLPPATWLAVSSTPARSISISGSGVVWRVGVEDVPGSSCSAPAAGGRVSVLRHGGTPDAYWEDVDGQTGVKVIAGRGDDEAYLLNACNEAFYYGGSGWLQIAGPAPGPSASQASSSKLRQGLLGRQLAEGSGQEVPPGVRGGAVSPVNTFWAVVMQGNAVQEYSPQQHLWSSVVQYNGSDELEGVVGVDTLENLMLLTKEHTVMSFDQSSRSWAQASPLPTCQATVDGHGQKWLVRWQDGACSDLYVCSNSTGSSWGESASLCVLVRQGHVRSLSVDGNGEAITVDSNGRILRSIDAQETLLTRFRRSPCTGSSCRNGGTCIPQGGSYECACRQGFGGNQCQVQAEFSSSPPHPSRMSPPASSRDSRSPPSSSPATLPSPSFFSPPQSSPRLPPSPSSLAPSQSPSPTPFFYRSPIPLPYSASPFPYHPSPLPSPSSSPSPHASPNTSASPAPPPYSSHTPSPPSYSTSPSPYNFIPYTSPSPTPPPHPSRSLLPEPYATKERSGNAPPLDFSTPNAQT